MPRLIEEGHEVVCLARNTGKLDGRPWRDLVEVRYGDVAKPESLTSALAGCEVAYYLVHSMGGPANFASSRPGRSQGVRGRSRGQRGAAHRLPRRPRQRGGRPVRAPLQPPRDRRGARRGVRARHGTPRGGDHRFRLGLLRDAALPHGGAADDGDPEVGQHPVPAHRDQGRPCLPCGRARGRSRQPRLRDRRARRRRVPRHDAGLREGRRVAEARARSRPCADAPAVRALDRPRHPAADRRRQAAGRLAAQRGDRPRPHRRTEVRCQADPAAPGRRTRARPQQRAGSRDPLVGREHQPGPAVRGRSEVGRRHAVHRSPGGEVAGVRRRPLLGLRPHRRTCRLLLPRLGMAGARAHRPAGRGRRVAPRPQASRAGAAARHHRLLAGGGHRARHACSSSQRR